ncbi:MAG: hypothetical protein ACI8RA_002966 [Chlamydiales bacterium]|jgi:hypothetical protein
MSIPPSSHIQNELIPFESSLPEGEEPKSGIHNKPAVIHCLYESGLLGPLKDTVKALPLGKIGPLCTVGSTDIGSLTFGPTTASIGLITELVLKPVKEKLDPKIKVFLRNNLKCVGSAVASSPLGSYLHKRGNSFVDTRFDEMSVGLANELKRRTEANLTPEAITAQIKTQKIRLEEISKRSEEILRNRSVSKGNFEKLNVEMLALDDDLELLKAQLAATTEEHSISFNDDFIKHTESPDSYRLTNFFWKATATITGSTPENPKTTELLKNKSDIATQFELKSEERQKVLQNISDLETVCKEEESELSGFEYEIKHIEKVREKLIPELRELLNSGSLQTELTEFFVNSSMPLREQLKDKVKPISDSFCEKMTVEAIAGLGHFALNFLISSKVSKLMTQNFEGHELAPGIRSMDIITGAGVVLFTHKVAKVFQEFNRSRSSKTTVLDQQMRGQLNTFLKGYQPVKAANNDFINNEISSFLTDRIQSQIHKKVPRNLTDLTEMTSSMVGLDLDSVVTYMTEGDSFLEKVEVSPMKILAFHRVAKLLKEYKSEQEKMDCIDHKEVPISSLWFDQNASRLDMLGNGVASALEPLGRATVDRVAGKGKEATSILASSLRTASNARKFSEMTVNGFTNIAYYAGKYTPASIGEPLQTIASTVGDALRDTNEHFDQLISEPVIDKEEI